MADPLPDALGALRAYLLADPDVAALVGTRVYGEPTIPEGEVPQMPRKLITLTYSGGIPSIAPENARIDVHCYGETPAEADRLRRAVHSALRRLERAVHLGVLLYGAVPAGGPLTLTDPDGGWPASWQPWTLTFASQLVA